MGKRLTWGKGKDGKGGRRAGKGRVVPDKAKLVPDVQARAAPDAGEVISVTVRFMSGGPPATVGVPSSFTVDELKRMIRQTRPSPPIQLFCSELGEDSLASGESIAAIRAVIRANAAGDIPVPPGEVTLALGGEHPSMPTEELQLFALEELQVQVQGEEQLAQQEATRVTWRTMSAQERGLECWSNRYPGLLGGVVVTFIVLLGMR